jgi:Na+/H+ antiporter NhaD/arsenite permease-like protein
LVILKFSGLPFYEFTIVKSLVFIGSAVVLGFLNKHFVAERLSDQSISKWTSEPNNSKTAKGYLILAYLVGIGFLLTIV